MFTGLVPAGLVSVIGVVEPVARQHGDVRIRCDLCLAAEKVTPTTVMFVAKEGRGLICLSLTGDRLDW